MPTFLADLLTQAKSIWMRLDAGQRMTIVSVILATVVGLGGIVWYAGKPDYVVLHEDPETFAEATAALAGTVPFTTKGDQILVASGEQFEIAKRLLREKGISGGRPASGLADMVGKTGTEIRDQLWNRKISATQTKILTSKQIRTVEILAFKPKRNQFLQDQEMAKATVIITLAPHADFHEAAGLSSDAAAAGLGIPRENVVVFESTTGQRYVANSKGGSAGSGKEFLRLRDEWEFRLNAKANGVLMQAYQGDVIVTVNVEFDHKSQYLTGVNLPKEGLPANHTKITKKESEAGGRNPGRAPSPGADQAARAGSGTSSKETDKTEEKTTDPALYGQKTVVQMAPEVLTKTASVLIKAGSEAEKEKDKILKLVAKAIGIDDADIAIEIVTFAAPPPPVAAEAGPDMMELAKSFAPAVGQVLAVILVIFFLKGMMKKSKRKPVDLQDQLVDPDKEPEDLAPEEVARRMRREIENAIDEDPAAISRLLDNWLTEQKV